MDVNHLAQKVKELRDAQKFYFKCRSQSQLQLCKKLEREIDQAVDHVLGSKQKQVAQPIQKSLF